jgi:hypothetical protein
VENIAGHAFISYVREDSDKVDALERILQAAGVPVWRDTASLWPGEDWRAKIRDAITHDALVFIACFSSSSVARSSSYQNEELLLAIEQLRSRQPNDPWLIPVRFDDCDVPDFELRTGRTLASIHRTDLFGPGREQAAERLSTVVRRLLGPRNPATTPPQGSAPRPASPPVRRKATDAPLFRASLTRPVLFVGLGGTGCDIGAELERRLREEICGPDGSNFRRLRRERDLKPYQLPSCVQFVYADMNQAELDRMPSRVVPGNDHEQAVAMTARYVGALPPPIDSYPEVKPVSICCVPSSAGISRCSWRTSARRASSPRC